jgi:hypothetical protein
MVDKKDKNLIGAAGEHLVYLAYSHLGCSHRNHHLMHSKLIF